MAIRNCSFSDESFDIFYQLIEHHIPESSLTQKALQRRKSASANLSYYELIASICSWAGMIDSIVLFGSDVKFIFLREYFEFNHINLYSRQTGERIKSANLIIDSRYRLDDKKLRRLFALIELAAYQLLQITYWDFNKNIKYDEVTLAALIKGLRSSKGLSTKSLDILERMRQTRNEFAHSIRDVDRLEYCGRPLEHSLNRINRTYARNSGSVRRLFIDDMYYLTNKMIERLRTVQHKQLNLRKVAAVLSCEFPIEIYQGQIKLTGSDLDVEEQARARQGLKSLV